MSELKLGRQSPRHYPWIEAFRGRVWRSSWALYGREMSLFAILSILYGFLLDEGILWELGLIALLLGITTSGIATLMGNLQCLHLVREGEWVEGELDELINMRLWHEFLRGKAHRSFKVKYRYQSPQGEKLIGEMVLCRCAYDRLSKNRSQVPVVIDPTNPNKSLLLRVAVMKIPH